jgi:heme exporter protein C
MKRIRWDSALGVLGVAVLLVGCYIGLFVAPAERHMGDVQRIMYVHVPTAWNAMLVLTAAFVFAIATVWSGKSKWDAMMTGATEAGVVMGALLIAQGMIWAKPTWGIWWDWDVRLTTTLIMVVLYAGILVLRSFVEDSERRATWSAVAVIVGYVDVPLVYFCVRWWRSLHQIQSTPETVSSAMILPLRINSFAILFIAIWFVAQRARLELARRRSEEVAPPPKREHRREEATAR